MSHAPPRHFSWCELLVRIARSAPRLDTEFLTTTANAPALGQQTSHAAICVVTPTASQSCWHRVSSGVCGPTPSLLLAPPQGPLQDPHSTPIPIGLLFSPLILLEQSYLFAASVTQSAPGCAPQGPSSQHHESRPAAAPLASLTSFGHAASQVTWATGRWYTCPFPGCSPCLQVKPVMVLEVSASPSLPALPPRR